MLVIHAGIFYNKTKKRRCFMKKAFTKKITQGLAPLILAASLSVSGCGGASSPTPPSEPAADAATTAPTVPETTTTAEVKNDAAPAPQPDDSERWDLTDIYPDEEAFRSDLAAFEKEYIPGIEQFRGKLGTVEGVLDYFNYFDKAMAAFSKLQNYVTLRTILDQGDSSATADSGEVMKLGDRYFNASAYASKELYANDDAFLDRLIADERMAPYKNQILREREQTQHLLDEREEQLLMPLMLQASGASTLYEKLANADMEFPTAKDSQGTEHPCNEPAYRNLVNSSPDRTLRENMSRTLLGTYGQYRNTLSQNMDNFVQAMVATAHFHHYDSAREASLASSAIPLAVYDNLLSTADSRLDVRHQAIRLRKEILGYDVLSNQDLVIPLVKDTDRKYPYQDAKKIVPEALAPLGETYCNDFRKALDSRWVDVYSADRKATNAASMGVNGIHPFIYLNYGDNYDSMSTLAHEMGHAMHQYYSDVYQESIYNKNVTTFATEVASLTNELLLSDYMISHAESDEEKLFYLSTQLTLLDSAFFNQTMYARFETDMYQIVEDGGSLTPDILETLWTDTCQKYYGPDFHPLEEGRYGWSRIPHFYYNHYVFQYATSIAASCNIVDRILAGEDGAVDQYLEFLQAGDASPDSVTTLKIAGVDMTAPSAYDALFQRYENLIAQIETLKQVGVQ